MPDGQRPNILVIWGDDIGITNLSCYSDGLMGYRTPNIDRIADEGMRFTDSYGEQSCPTSAGNASRTPPPDQQADGDDRRRDGRRGKGLHPDRRLQPAAVPDRRGRQEPAARVRLLLRRRRRAGPALRQWKVVFMEQQAQGTLQIWAEPFVALRVRKLFNLRTDPFERADITSNTYHDWFLDNDYIALAATTVMTEFLATFKDFPPRQKAASFTIDQVVAKLENALTEGR
jgi:arylsulfatase A-like enzyme